MIRVGAALLVVAAQLACSSDSSCDAGCSDGMQCVEGTCRPPCSEDAGCAAGEICSGVCIPGERPPLPTICDNPNVISRNVLITKSSDQAPLQGEGCVIIRGDLALIGSSLDTLYAPAAVAVQGTLRIANNPDLDSLYGLQGLRMVEGDVLVHDNPELRSLILPALESIGGRLEVRGNVNVSDSDCQQFLLLVQARGGSVCER